MQISEIAQVDFIRWFTCWIIHFSNLYFDFASWICDFATWRWFHNLEMICNLICSLEVISQFGSQLRKWSSNLWSGTRVLAGGFAAAKHLAKFSQADFVAAKSTFSLVQLASNGYNFFILSLIRAPFESLDSWLPDLRNNI